MTRVQSQSTTANVDKTKTRKDFVSALKKHGVTESQDFSYCTNAIYHGVLGHSAHEHLAKLRLRASANLRKHLTEAELNAVEFAEYLSTKEINEQNPSDAADCLLICRTTAGQVGKLFRSKKT